jgi:FixJ family two-component response regulator
VASEKLICVVDDDPSVREGLMDLLASMGYRAAVFASAEVFLAAGVQRHAACLITDGRMPGMGGFELFRCLRGAGLQIPTILITAFPSVAERGRAMQAGMHCYLPKPFDERELLGCLRSALAAPRARQP